MKGLFVGLLIAGVALVVGVFVYNWLQERRVRRRTLAAFTRPGNQRQNVEPSLGGDYAGMEVGARVSVADAAADAAADAEDDRPFADADLDEALPQPLSVAPGAHEGIAPDPDIECVALLQPAAPVPSEALGRAPALHPPKPLRWLGRRGAGLPWQPVEGAAGPWQEVAVCLLLADRSGAASRRDIEGFLQSVAAVASTLSAACSLPDAGDEAERAEELDRFCADLDVQIGLTILKAEPPLAGTRLRGVVEAAGFRLDPRGQFEYVDEIGAVLCRLQNYQQGEPFTVESLRLLTTPGVVLLIDVPRVAEPVRVFDQIRLVAKRLAQTLEAVLVDDNRRPLDDAALSTIRGQVQATAAALSAAHIEPGGARALRLFG